MRCLVLLFGLAAALGAASVAHSHDEVELPELPIPEIDQLFPVEDMAEAFRWADREVWQGDAYGNVVWGFSDGQRQRVDSWVVVALSEGQFGRVASLLAGIQQPQNSRPDNSGSLNFKGKNGQCSGLDGRFGVYLQGWSQGGVDDEFLWTFGRGLASNNWARGFPHHLLKNRFSVAGGYWASDTELRDTGFSIEFNFVLVDDAWCARGIPVTPMAAPGMIIKSTPLYCTKALIRV